MHAREPLPNDNFDGMAEGYTLTISGKLAMRGSVKQIEGMEAEHWTNTKSRFDAGLVKATSPTLTAVTQSELPMLWTEQRTTFGLRPKMRS